MISISSLDPQAAAAVIGAAFSVPVTVALLARYLVRVVLVSRQS